MNIPTDLQSLLDEFQAAWNSHDQARLKGLWDATYPHLVYIAEERRQPMLGWEAIRDYYIYTLSVMEWMKVKVKPLSADVLGDVAWIVGKGSWGGKNRGRDKVSSGNSRVSFLARRGDKGWRLIHYIEAPVNSTYAPAQG